MHNLVLILTSIATCRADAIPMIGVKENSTVVIQHVPTDHYIKSLKATKEALDSQLMQGLSAHQDKGVWKLHKVVIGLGVQGEIGFGPFRIGKYLKQRFGYTR